MPLLDIQRRMVELGRIRLGVQKDTGNGRTRPEKLSTFRFTSPHQRHIDDLARLYGGDARPWQNGTKPEHEVITTTTSIPVIVLPDATSQWYETWSGGGCQRRCDGEREHLQDRACVCAQEVQSGDQDDRTCKPTTRVGLMLPELEAVGLWRLETHGWNAAAELPGSLDLAAMVGRLVPARLLLADRTAVRDGKTSRFVVPVLDIQVAPARLAEIAAAAGGQAITGGPTQAAPALGPGPAAATAVGAGVPTQRAGEPTPVGALLVEQLVARVQAVQSVDELRALYAAFGREGHPRLAEVDAAIAARAAELSQPVAVVDEQGQDVPDAGADADAAYARLMAAAGERGLSMAEVDQLITDLHGKPAGALTADQLLEVVGSLPPAATAKAAPAAAA